MGTAKEPSGEEVMTPTDEQRVDDIVEEMPDSQAPQEEPQKEPRVGYAVGITEDGQFDFAVFGSEPGLVELMGLHKYAEMRIQRLLNEKQMAGDILVHEVGKAVAALHQKLDKLMGAGQPTNQLK